MSFQTEEVSETRGLEQLVAEARRLDLTGERRNNIEEICKSLLDGKTLEDLEEMAEATVLTEEGSDGLWSLSPVNETQGDAHKTEKTLRLELAGYVMLLAHYLNTSGQIDSAGKNFRAKTSTLADLLKIETHGTLSEVKIARSQDEFKQQCERIRKGKSISREELVQIANILGIAHQVFVPKSWPAEISKLYADKGPEGMKKHYPEDLFPKYYKAKAAVELKLFSVLVDERARCQLDYATTGRFAHLVTSVDRSDCALQKDIRRVYHENPPQEPLFKQIYPSTSQVVQHPDFRDGNSYVIDIETSLKSDHGLLLGEDSIRDFARVLKAKDPKLYKDTAERERISERSTALEDITQILLGSVDAQNLGETAGLPEETEDYEKASKKIDETFDFTGKGERAQRRVGRRRRGGRYSRALASERSAATSFSGEYATQSQLNSQSEEIKRLEQEVEELKKKLPASEQ